MRIEVRGVGVRYRAVEALAGVSLAASPGRTLAIMGPNGAGKSTLLRVMGLLEPPSSGAVRVDGRDVDATQARGLLGRVVCLFQDPLVLAGTVRFNAELGARFARRPDAAGSAAAAMGRLGLSALARRRAASLSGGEKRRLALARALAVEPEALLLDEPFAGLDAPSRDALLHDLAPVLRERTAVVVLHHRDEALRVGDEIAVLIGGRLRQQGPISQVFANPADTEVAAFLGAENLLHGRVVGTGDGTIAVEVGGQRVIAASAPRDGEVVLCLRPEDVVLAVAAGPPPAVSAANILEAVVGARTAAPPLVRVVLDAGFPLVAVATSAGLAAVGAETGARVRAVFKAAAVHVLPAA